MGGDRPPGYRPRIVIVGAGISGLVVASLLEDIPADVIVLDQAMSPSRQRVFPGIVSASDLRAVGLTADPDHALPVTRVTDAATNGANPATVRVTKDWMAIKHGNLLGALKASAESNGVTFIPDATVTGFRWEDGVVAGVENTESGTSYLADIVVIGDECSPRLAERLGLRPDWSPTELMHVGKRWYGADPETVRDRMGVDGADFDVISLEMAASWGSPGWALIIPGPDSISVVVAMSLEEAMVSARHISEYFDEVERQLKVQDCIDGLTLETYVTEVVPTGGFDTRHTFHTDGVIVVSDLVGVTHPLNRDGLSSNLVVAAAAARTIVDAVANDDYRSVSLRRYSEAIVDEITSPVNAARRTDKLRRSRQPWQWAVKADLFAAFEGVTVGPNSATLPGVGDTGILQRLRGFGRIPGVRRHAPGEYDE
ncbi:MAG: NAD(P)/FAD-dependent oxidoreductase [Thermomicrobiales bacterium]